MRQNARSAGELLIDWALSPGSGSTGPGLLFRIMHVKALSDHVGERYGYYLAQNTPKPGVLCMGMPWEFLGLAWRGV
jgi:hypothetical protein